MRRITAFTLVELLVVISIIVILLALLAPALDKAVYQAELTVCGANLKGIAGAVTAYAGQHRQCYPHTGTANGGGQPAWIGTGDGTSVYDRRYELAAALGSLNKWFNDPLTNARLDFEGSTARFIYSNYSLFFGAPYAGHKALRKVGDRFTYTERTLNGPATVERSSNILASDRDLVMRYAEAQSSHPDADGVLAPLRRQDEPSPWANQMTAELQGETMTIALWRATTASRGYTDDNFASADGSVLRVNAIYWNEDERLARPPQFHNIPTVYPAWFMYLPK